MRIGALARSTGVSERLLRYYEEQGLLRPARGPNGYREYDEPDVAVVGHIRALLAAGLPTTVIAQILHCVHGDGDEVFPEPCQGMITQLQREHTGSTRRSNNSSRPWKRSTRSWPPRRDTPTAKPQVS